MAIGSLINNEAADVPSTVLRRGSTVQSHVKYFNEFKVQLCRL